MPVHRGQDRCSECKTPLPGEGPCPKCGSTKRTVPLGVQAGVAVSGSVDRRLLISWHEVDRLLDKEEYAAALLVAAVNVEFILWVNLCRFSTASKPSIQDNRISSMWGQVTNDHPDKLTLSSLHKVADYMSQRHGLVLVGSWEPVVSDIEDVRNRIGHERGCFAKLTQLRDPNWSETRIREVLDEAKAFCHGNAA